MRPARVYAARHRDCRILVRWCCYRCGIEGAWTASLIDADASARIHNYECHRESVVA